MSIIDKGLVEHFDEPAMNLCLKTGQHFYQDRVRKTWQGRGFLALGKEIGSTVSVVVYV